MLVWWLISLVNAQTLFGQYYKYEELLIDLEFFSSSNEVDLLTIGKTMQNNDIHALRINSSYPRSILIIGGIHANELLSTLQIVDFIKTCIGLRD